MALRDFLYAMGGEETPEKRRRKEWDGLVQRNPGLAPTAEDYNRGMEEYIQTGNLPTSRPTGGEVRTDITPTKHARVAGTDVSILPTTEVRPELAPIQLDPAFSFNRGTGGFTPVSGVPGRAKVYEFDPTKTTAKEAKLYIYNADGKLVETRPWKGDTDHVVTLSREPALRPPAGAGRETPQEKAARQALAEYDRALKSGKDVSRELTERAAEAAQFLGLPTETVNVPAEAPWFSRNTPAHSYERPSFGAPAAPKPAAPPPAPAGKPISKEQAMEFLRQAGGDRQKARELARQGGFSF